MINWIRILVEIIQLKLEVLLSFVICVLNFYIFKQLTLLYKVCEEENEWNNLGVINVNDVFKFNKACYIDLSSHIKTFVQLLLVVSSIFCLCGGHLINM